MTVTWRTPLVLALSMAGVAAMDYEQRPDDTAITRIEATVTQLEATLPRLEAKLDSLEQRMTALERRNGLSRL